MFDCDLNRRVLDSLIRAGAFDSMGVKRSQLTAVASQVVDGIAQSRKKNLEGQFDLFGGGGEAGAPPDVSLPDIPEFSKRELMAMEKEATGLYLTGHPMDEYRQEAQRQHAVPVAAILADFQREEGPQNFRDGQTVVLAGIISSAKTKSTKNGSLMAYVTLEDDSGAMELLVFSRVLGECGPYLQAGMPVLARGKLSVRDEKAPQMLADHIGVLGRPDPTAQAAGGPGKKLYIRLPDRGERFTWLKKLMQMFPGDQAGVVFFADTGEKLRATYVFHPALVAELREKLGEENVVVK